MRKLWGAAILGSTLLAGAVSAAEPGAYIGLGAGVVMPEKQSFKDAADTRLYGLDSNNGVAGFGVAGYDFGRFRLEGEFGYQRSGTGKLKNIAEPAVQNALTGANVASKVNIDGSRRALSGMANGLIDLPVQDWFEFYLGGGVGVARVDNKRVRSQNAVLIDNADSGFAWQGMFGLRKQLTERIEAGLGYRYFAADATDYRDLVAARDVEGKYRAHILSFGINYRFGAAKKPEAAPAPVVAAPPPPPPPVAEPAPPAPVAEAPLPGPFIVFFDWDSAVVTPEAAAILSDAAEAYRRTGMVRILVEGHADRSGPTNYNDRLSGRRAEAVVAELTRLGVAADAVTSRAFGENQPLIETLDGVREPQNRRVEISFPE